MLQRIKIELPERMPAEQCFCKVLQLQQFIIFLWLWLQSEKIWGRTCCPSGRVLLFWNLNGLKWCVLLVVQNLLRFSVKEMLCDKRWRSLFLQSQYFWFGEQLQFQVCMFYIFSGTAGVAATTSVQSRTI